MISQITKKVIFILVGIVVGLILVFVAFEFYWRISIEKVQVKRGNLKVTVSSSGHLKSENEANLSFKATGKIAYLPVKENQQVKKWQTVAALDRELLESALRQAKQDVIAADAELEKVYDSLRNKSGVESFDDKIKRTAAEAEKNKAFDAAKDAEKALANAVLYAPFEGTVTKVNGSIGEWVSSFSQEPLITLADFDSLYFEAEIAQEDSDEIKPGQKAIIGLDAKTEEKIQGEVYEVPTFTRTNSEGNVIVPVKIRISDYTGGLKIGWEGDAQIQIDEKVDVLLVPKKAVEKLKDENIVYVFGKRGKEKKRVRLGAFDGASWEILEGLKEFEEIAIKK